MLVLLDSSLDPYFSTAQYLVYSIPGIFFIFLNQQEEGKECNVCTIGGGNNQCVRRIPVTTTCASNRASIIVLDSIILLYSIRLSIIVPSGKPTEARYEPSRTPSLFPICMASPFRGHA